jgi:uncharacterized protein YukE
MSTGIVSPIPICIKWLKGCFSSANDADKSQDLDQLIETLSGDLSAIDSETALEMIDQWHGFLHKSKEPTVKELANGLKQLQKLLKSDNADSGEIGEVLEDLGEQTGDLASEAEKGWKANLQKLSKSLAQAGKALNKADEQEHLKEMNDLIKNLEEEDLTSVEAEVGTQMIDHWYNVLHKQEGKPYQELASTLKELKQRVKKSNADPEAIAEVLSHLGEQTREIAADAPRGFKTVVQKLGKRLIAAAESFDLDDEDEE